MYYKLAFVNYNKRVSVNNRGIENIQKSVLKKNHSLGPDKMEKDFTYGESLQSLSDPLYLTV